MLQSAAYNPPTPPSPADSVSSCAPTACLNSPNTTVALSADASGHTAQAPAFARPMDLHGSETDSWQHVEGDYVSVMCLVTPCRSDKSTRGVLPHAHIAGAQRLSGHIWQLACQQHKLQCAEVSSTERGVYVTAVMLNAVLLDTGRFFCSSAARLFATLPLTCCSPPPPAAPPDGVLHLVLVHRCTRPQYLQFLITLTTKGITPGQFDFVEVSTDPREHSQAGTHASGESQTSWQCRTILVTSAAATH